MVTSLPGQCGMMFSTLVFALSFRPFAEGIVCMHAVDYTHDMSKRLQVIVGDAEYRELQRTARRHRLTVSEWVRRLIREASRQEPQAGPDRKLAVVREAVHGAYPTADIGMMLRDIERGYLDER